MFSVSASEWLTAPGDRSRRIWYVKQTKTCTGSKPFRSAGAGMQLRRWQRLRKAKASALQLDHKDLEGLVGDICLSMFAGRCQADVARLVLRCFDPAVGRRHFEVLVSKIDHYPVSLVLM